MKTLIVEDELTSRLLLQGLLSRFGTCHTVSEGTEALEAFRIAAAQGEKYDLICMDIMMPGTDGAEIVKHIRNLEEGWGVRSNQGARIVMTTGVHDTREVFRSFHNLCDAYLKKPIDGKLLMAKLQEFKLVQCVAVP